jgi:hypothetical protein
MDKVYDRKSFGKIGSCGTSSKFFIDGVEISKENIQKFNLKDTKKNLSLRSGTLQLYGLTIDIHNPTQRIYHTGNCSIGIATSSNFPESTNTASRSRIPGEIYIHQLHPIDTIFPGAWRSISLEFGAIKSFIRDTFAIRLFTELGWQDLTIEVQPER